MHYHSKTSSAEQLDSSNVNMDEFSPLTNPVTTTHTQLLKVTTTKHQGNI
jgi:hypothetical protein